MLLTHLDTDHIGAVEADGGGLFRNAIVYLGEIENRYLTGERKRRVLYRLGSLPRVRIPNEKVLLRDGQVFTIGDIQIECFLVPGHTWGHMVYLLDGRYLLTGDAIWLGADGGYSFLASLAEDNRLAVRALAEFEGKLRARNLRPLVVTGHTGYSADLDFVFAHCDLCCKTSDRRFYNPAAPYDAYDESEDTLARSATPL